MPQALAVLARDVKKSLGRRPVLRTIDLAVEPGECVVLRGDNGSGKTTLIRCLAGLLRPDAGRIRWFGRESSHPEARRQIGLAAHESGLHPHLTLRENLVLWGRLQGLSDAHRRAERWLDRAGLRHAADRRPREVSQGMRRRASIARAVLHDPPILLLDEPSAGLDDSGRRWLGELFNERQAQGRATCLVTHEESVDLPANHRMLELGEGVLRPRVAAHASIPTRLRESPAGRQGVTC